jgi:hypothetical protein
MAEREKPLRVERNAPAQGGVSAPGPARGRLDEVDPQVDVLLQTDAVEHAGRQGRQQDLANHLRETLRRRRAFSK